MLSNGNLASFRDGALDSCIKLFDKNFKLIKTFDEIFDSSIGKRNIRPISITSDGKNCIYIKDERIMLIMTDLELNYIKSTKERTFTTLGDVCYFNDHVYVTDTYKIRKYSADLENFEIKNLDYNPFKIAIIDGIACVACEACDEYTLNFYDLDNFNLKKQYVIGDCRPIVLNSKLYVYEFEQYMVRCYDNNGLVIKEFTSDLLDNEILFCGLDGATVFFHDSILILSITQHQVYKLQVF